MLEFASKLNKSDGKSEWAQRKCFSEGLEGKGRGGMLSVSSIPSTSVCVSLWVVLVLRK